MTEQNPAHDDFFIETKEGGKVRNMGQPAADGIERANDRPTENKEQPNVEE